MYNNEDTKGEIGNLEQKTLLFWNAH